MDLYQVVLVIVLALFLNQFFIVFRQILINFHSGMILFMTLFLPFLYFLLEFLSNYIYFSERAFNIIRIILLVFMSCFWLHRTLLRAGYKMRWMWQITYLFAFAFSGFFDIFRSGAG